MGKLGDHLANERLVMHQAEQNRELANERSLNYLYDARGTPLEQLLDADNVLLAHEFIDITSRDGHPYATKIELVESRSTKGLLKWITGGVKSEQKPIWNGKGYYIGRTSGASTYLCADGKLRCERATDMFPQSGSYITNGPSWVSGYGTIPPEYTDMETGVLKNEGASDFRYIKYYHYSMELESLLKYYLTSKTMLL